jgi:hypothetical protein
MRFALRAAGVAALVLLHGCGTDGTAPASGESARLRLASASPDAGALDLLVNGRTVARAVGRTTASAATEVEAGRTMGEVRATGTSATLASVPLTLEGGKSYTVLAAGPLQALTVMVSVDTGSGGQVPPPSSPPGEPVDSGNAPPPLADAARFRIVHAAPHAPPLDPYLTPAGSPLDTVPALEPFEYGSLALIADLTRRPGHYTAQFTEAGTTRVVMSSDDIDAKAGELLTVVLGENADRSLRVDVVRE